MEYTLENELLRVCVTTNGAPVRSVVRKCDGGEHMWQADASVWGYHAPILFPYTGKLDGGVLEARGSVGTGCPQHGFARTLEHRFVRQSGDTLVLELTDTPETRALWPYAFRLVSTFRLEGDTLHHTLTVENADSEPIRFGIGFHPAFALPFDGAHRAEDYELRFSRPESPLCLGTMPHGLLNGSCYYLGRNIDSLPLDEKLFANDSHCMVNLTSQTLGVYEKGTGRGVVCRIAGFPYTLIWSKPGVPKFVCIEPWNSIPSAEGSGSAWDEKPAAAIVPSGESWSTTLSTAFVR